MSDDNQPVENQAEEAQETDSQIVDSKFSIGDIVKHKFFEFRGVIFDVDASFSNTDEWYLSIPKPLRPDKNQPFYHLLAENSRIFYTAYVSQQNLVEDQDSGPVNHPDLAHMFGDFVDGRYELKENRSN